MKTPLNHFVSLICLMLFTCKGLIAQNNMAASWSKKFEYQKVFIENKGQFIIPTSFGNSGEVLYAVDNGGTKIFFTKKGITYTFLEPSKKQKDAREIERELKEEFSSVEEFAEHEKEERRLKVKADQVTMLWQNANENVKIEASGMTNDYHSYHFKQQSTQYKNISYVKGFKKITYKNIYPHIDIEYVFAEKDGLKYSLILHPGADPSQVKMVYDNHVSLNSNGEVRIDTKFGDIIDHAPLTFYQQNHHSIITSAFTKSDKTISFQLANYDNTKEVVIDPWTQTPVFPTNWDCVWECERDGAGNTYIIGGVSPMQLLKYNAAGALQWTYNTPYDTTAWLGTFAVDNVGNSYVTQGSTARIVKVSTAGAVVWNNTSPGGISLLTEFWCITFNCDQTRLIIGGTGGVGLSVTPFIYEVNMASGNVVSSQKVAGGGGLGKEVRAIAPCGNGRYYFLSHDTIGYISQNFAACSTPNAALYKTSSGYNLSYKCENYRYDNSGIMAIKANTSFVYVNRGNQVDKRDLNTSAIISSAPIPGGGFAGGFGGNVVQNSGIDIDDCGNVYVGSKNAIIKYDANLTQLASYPTTYNVYDVHVQSGGNIIACGSTGTSATGSRTGTIEHINASACTTISLTCCDVNICPVTNLCSTAAPFNLQAATAGGTWSGAGITNATAGTFNPGTAGVGTHVITYSLACGVGTTTITVSACGTVSLCISSGSLTVIGGASTYTWASTTTSVNCAACPGGNCIPFVCAGVTVPTWTASGTTVAAPSSTVFPIKVKDLGSGITFTFTTLASIPPCTTTACPTLTMAITSQTNVNCFGANTGSASVGASGGTGPYTYTWSPGNLTGASQTGLTAGTYTIAIKDANSCVGTGTVTITQPTAAIGAVISATTAAGCGSATGGATVTASGGTPGYSYSWTPGGTTTAGVSNLGSGTNSVTVTDAKGCTVTAVANITSAGGPTLSVVSQTNVNCFGTSTGMATISQIGGTGPYTYTWTPGNLNGASQINLSAGAYTVNVTDANSCVGSTTITITQPTAAVGAVMTATTAAGCGTSTGGATVTTNGGTPGYSYSWTPGGGTTAGVSNLNSGTNSVTVTDAKGCTVTAIANITTAGGPTLSVTSQTNVNCFGASTGSATINAAGGTAPVTYTWIPGNLNGAVQTALAAGLYTVNASDANACASTTTVLITQPTASLSATISNTTAPGCGLSNGAASVTVSGGTPSYTYGWSPGGATTASVNNLSSGNSTVTITDAKGCIATSVVSLNSTSGPTLTIVAQTSVSCFGGNNGTATVNATGGSGPYTYTWTPGNLTGAIQPSLSAGVYTVIVKDASQCIGTHTISITQPTAGITGTILTTPTGCGNSIGSATVTASGGVPAYTYSWAPTAGSGASISGLAAGSYSVVVTDSKGCQVTVNTSVNTTGAGPGLSVASQTNAICFSSTNAGASILATGTGPFSYTWSPTGGNAAVSNGLTGGTYTVFVSDASLCLSTITLTISQPPAIVVTVTNTTASCGNYDGTATVIASGGTGSLTPLWNVNSNSTTVTGLSAGTYSVLVTDATGCTGSAITNVNSVGTLTVNVGTNTTIYSGDNTQIFADIPAGASVVWSPTTGLSCATCSNTTASPTVTTEYCAYTTIGSCSDTSCVLITVDINCVSSTDYSAPTAFSPNNDGVNDEFCLQGWSKCVTGFYIGIYNRWGEKVYDSEDVSFCWDGKFLGNPLNSAVFVYYIKATVKDVGEIIRKGNITLVK
ncbi:MAG: gliding motility-associated C-terminal domain-containing protein [Bacteroidota bacterium]